ncbi:MAG TPA: tagaturonate epimerase family protein, partial [Tepidisphaeraceae bacterium]|nr:tagaturonate epimerase family protein [Tepidisphaeraceae bacterium]
LYAISLEKIPLQTIAPKFTGRFNKGVDYVGSLPQFEKEFNDDLSILSYSISEFGLPSNLKLSVHSGSDKFSLYPIIRSALRRHHAGLHIKTAGTTWLEELIGLAEAGGEALSLAKHCYLQSLSHCDDLCAPYATVINIDQSQLPPAHEVQSWTCQDFTSALRHDPANPHYNPHLRQLLHVGYKVAAQLGTTYTDALKSNQSIIAQNVTQNLYNRHIQPLFLD